MLNGIVNHGDIHGTRDVSNDDVPNSNEGTKSKEAFNLNVNSIHVSSDFF